MSATTATFAHPSNTRRVAQAFAEVVAGFIPVLFLLYALLASGCASPVKEYAPSVKSVLSQRISKSTNPQPAGNGSGSFTALLVTPDQALPSLARTSAAYSLALNSATHSVGAGQAIGAQASDDSGNAYYVFMLAQSFAAPIESVMVALPASSYAAGALTLDGSTAVAYLVDANGNPLAYTTSGTLTLTAAPTAVGQYAAGSFTGSFALVPTCSTDADCGQGAMCVSGGCVPADCTRTGCPSGMSCDAASGACVQAGCTSDANCGAGQACRNGACVAAGCAATGCPAGTTCDATSGQCLVTPASCSSDADCASGQQCVANACVAGCASGQASCAGACRDLSTDPANCGACGMACPAGATCQRGVCLSAQGCQTTGCPAGTICDPSSGQCVAQPTGCAQTGCPAGQTCDASSGLCVTGGTTTGSCYAQPWMGSGSFSGKAGGVAMCSAAGLDSVTGGPDAGLFDSADPSGNPATMFVIGDLQGSGDTYFMVLLDHCPGANDTLTAPASQFLVMHQSITSDTVFQVQKTASAGTLKLVTANGTTTATVTATFGTDTVTGSATLSAASYGP